MNLRICLWVTSSLVVSLQLLAQQKNPSRFHWDFRQNQELGEADSIRKAKNLSPGDRDALIGFMEDALRPFMSNSEDGIRSKKELREIALDTGMRIVDLNGDGKPEVILQARGLQAGCGATGNCGIWVLEKSATGYRDIIHRNTFAVQTFTIQPGVSNGYKDLVLGMHNSASEQELLLLRFREGKYRRSGCYIANWTIVTPDTVQELKTPRITPCG